MGRMAEDMHHAEDAFSSDPLAALWGRGRGGAGGVLLLISKSKTGPLTPPYLGQLKCRSDKLGVSKASGAKTQLHA